MEGPLLDLDGILDGMSKETRDEALLDLSIKHWEQNVAAIEPTEASTNAGDCALCRQYLLKNDRDHCGGCPVKVKTGSDSCRDTPYHNAAAWYQRWYHSQGSIYFEEYHKKWREAAQAELDFLVNLQKERNEYRKSEDM